MQSSKLDKHRERLRAAASSLRAASAERDLAIYEAVKAGLSQTDAAHLVGLSKQRVHQIVREQSD